MSGTINTGGGNVIINMRVTGQPQAATAFGQMQRQLQDLRGHASAFELELRNIDRTLRYLAAGAVISLTGGLINLAGELERQTILLQTMEGTFARANERMDQMVTLARVVPFSLSTISDAFVKLRTAGIDPIIDAQGNGPLRNLLDAVAAFGGTDQQLARAATAIQQMAGKGVVSMEELRQQLGEAIPTAIRAMATGMGISIAELIEKVSRGQVVFSEGVTAMLSEFQRAYAGAGELLNSTFFGAIRQLKTELDTLALSFNRAGGLDIFTVAIQALQRAFRGLNETLTSSAMSEAFDSFANWMMVNSNSIAGFINVLDQFVTLLATVATAIGGVISALPAESIAGGLIGWVLFGRAGLVAGAILGPVSEAFVGIIQGFVALIGGMMASTSALGAGAGEIATFGIIGFMLFGRTGMLLGAMLALADTMVGMFRRMIATMVADAIMRWTWLKSQFTLGFTNPLSPRENLAESERLAKEARDSFLRNNASQESQAFGDISTTPFGAFLKNSRDAAREGASSVESFVQKLQQLREQVAINRREFEGRFSNPEAIGGVTQRDIKDLEDFTKALDRAGDRLVGSRGRAVDAWASAQRRVAEQFEASITRMDAARIKAAAEGRTGDADAIQATVERSRANLARFRQTIDDVVKSETDKANASAGRVVGTANAGLERFQANIRAMREQIEAFQAQSDQGKNSEAAEVEKVEAQYATLQRRLETMRIDAERSRGTDALQAETLRQLTTLQLQLNEAREKAIEIARRKAQWEREDAERGVSRATEDAASRLNRERLGQMPGGEFQAGIEQRRDALRGSLRQLDDEIRVMERRVLESGGQDSWANQWIENLRKIREGFQELYVQVGTFAEREKTRSKDLFDDIGNSLESSFARGLETLISGTGKMKDVINGFFNDITRAVSKYLTNMLFQEANAAGGAGTGGLLMKGFTAIAGAMGGGGGAIEAGQVYSSAADVGPMLMSAMGNVFNQGRHVPAFARGGAFTNRVVSGPTLFNMGMMGEAGPEAIMPLARIGGKLGVAAHGGGSDNFQINITALDSASVRDLFYREGGALVGSLQQRNRLNRGMR